MYSLRFGLRGPRLPGVTSGKVKWFSDEEGWGVLTSDDVPGDVFVHFSHIDADGYRTLGAGEPVQFEWEHYPSRARRLLLPRDAGSAGDHQLLEPVGGGETPWGEPRGGTVSP